MIEDYCDGCCQRHGLEEACHVQFLDRVAAQDQVLWCLVATALFEVSEMLLGTISQVEHHQVLNEHVLVGA